VTSAWANEVWAQQHPIEAVQTGWKTLGLKAVGGAGSQAQRLTGTSVEKEPKLRGLSESLLSCEVGSTRIGICGLRLQLAPFHPR